MALAEKNCLCTRRQDSGYGSKPLENYPYKYAGPKRKATGETVTILYNGWLGVHRGTELVEALLATGQNFRFIMAGWFADNRTRQLPQHPQVEYRGILHQSEALRIAAMEADYILCVYAPINENNINASPNKIYDAIQTNTPVIINREIRIAEFVEKNRLGVIIDQYATEDAQQLAELLFTMKGSFHFDDYLADRFSWEHIEHILINAHGT
jgi:hypothetical protein